MANKKVAIYTLDNNTFYEENCIQDSDSVQLYVEADSKGEEYAQKFLPNSYNILYTSFDINLQDISTECVIGEGAFQNHNELTTIEIPNSVVKIGQKAFLGCEGLTSISLPFVGEHKDSEKTFGWIFYNEGVIQDTDELTLPKNLTTVNITGNVDTIQDNAFKGATQLTQINLPDSITKIGSSSFYNTGVINLTIPVGVIKLGKKAFQEMDSLRTFSWYTTNYKLQDTKEYHGIEYFDQEFLDNASDKTKSQYSMYGYQHITNASTITDEYYGTEKFTFNDTEHDKLSTTPSLIVNEKTMEPVIAFAPILSRFFEDDKLDNPLLDLQGRCGDNLTYVIEPVNNNYKVIIKGYGDMMDYQQAEAPWYSFNSQIIELQLPDSITSIGNYAFYGLSEVTQIILPQTITAIGDFAFSGCTKAKFSDLMLEHTDNLLRLLYLKTIGKNAFEGCQQLVEFNCEQGSLTHINTCAFQDCSQLTTVKLSNTSILLEEGIFLNCDKLQTLSIPISSDIGKGLQNDFTKFLSNYRKYNIGSLFTTKEQFPSIQSNYIVYNCWLAGLSYWSSSQQKSEGLQISDTQFINTINNLYVPCTLKNITILNGVMPQFYLYIGSEENCYWDSVILKSTVLKTIYFRRSSNITNGFKNTEVVCDTSGRLVGVIANNIELYNITMDTFYNEDGLLGFHTYTYTTDKNYWQSRNAINSNKGITIKTTINNNNYYRNVYSYSKSYNKIVCKGNYSKFIVEDQNIIVEQLNLVDTSVSTLSDTLFTNKMNITNLFLPQTVKKINKLNTLKITKIHGHSEGVITNIVASAFEGNTVLTEFNCKIQQNTLADKIFYNCTNLTTVEEIDGKNIVIGKQVFYNCNYLKNMKFSKNSTVDTVQEQAFYNCNKLNTQLPCSANGLSVGDQSFYHCQNIDFVYLGQTKSIKIKQFLGTGTAQFVSCKSLKYIQLDSQITTIPNNCFAYCDLQEVRVPMTVTSIGYYAFNGYRGTWIELPTLSSKTLSQILGNGSPDPNSILTDIYISNSIEIPANAFSNWTTLKHVYFDWYKCEQNDNNAKLNKNKWDQYFNFTYTNGGVNIQEGIPWNEADDAFTMKTQSNYTNLKLTLIAKQDFTFYFEWIYNNNHKNDMAYLTVNDNSTIYLSPNFSKTTPDRYQFLLNKGDYIVFNMQSYNQSMDTLQFCNMRINICPIYTTNDFLKTATDKPEPYPNMLPWNEKIVGGNTRLFSLLNNTINNSNQCLYLNNDKEYLWRLLLYGNQYDVYITDNNTYTEQYSYLPTLYAPNHNGIEVGQHIELQGENTYEIIETQQFKHTGKIYYRQSQGVVNGKISYYSVSNGTLTYNVEQETYEVDDSLKEVLNQQFVEFSTGSTYNQLLQKGKIKMINSKIVVELDDNITNEEFQYGALIALKNVVVQKATLKSELLSVINEGSQFVVANSNQLQTVIDINDTYEITIEPGFSVNTTGYNEIQVTLAGTTRILPYDILNTEVVMVVNTQGKIIIEGNLDEEVYKGVIDEHLLSLIDINKSYFTIKGNNYLITDVDVLNKIVYFKHIDNKGNIIGGYIIDNQTIYEYDILLQEAKDLSTDKGFDTTDLHLTLNYINVFEIETIKPYVINSNLEYDFDLQMGEQLYLIKCKEVVTPKNYEVNERDLEKEAIIERYSTILIVSNLDKSNTQHLLVSPNTNYYIYSNNIKTPPYYFEVKRKRNIQINYMGEEIVDGVNMDCGSGLFEATYEDNIASCTWSLQELYEDEYIEIDKVVNQYTSNLFYNYHLFKNNTTYKLVVTIVTEDGLIITKSLDIFVTYDPQLDIVQVKVEKDCDKQAIKINLKDIGLKIKDLDYKICPRTWLTDPNAIYQIDSLYIIRENLEEPEEKAVVAQVQGFPNYVYDYSFNREDKYKYSILPIYYHIDNPSKLIRGVPSVIEQEIQYNLKSIVLISTELDLRENIQENDLLFNHYQVEQQQFSKWYFKYNTDARNINIMTDKTVFETISQFATVNYTNRNYKTGSVTAFLGAFHKNEKNAEWTYKDSIRLQNKFQEFANNGKIKMLRDEIGNVIPVDITLKSFEYNSHTIPTNITVSFEWTQVDTEKNFTVFENEYDEKLEQQRKDNKLPNYKI